MKIRNRLAIATIATSIILSLSFLACVVAWVEKDSKEKVQETFKYQSLNLSRELASFTFERSGDVEIIASQVGDLLQEKNSNSIANILNGTKIYHKIYQDIFFIDKNNIKRFDTSRTNIGRNSHYPFFELAKNKKESIFEFYKNPETNQEMLTFAHSVNAQDGKFLGVLVGDVSFQSVKNISLAILNLPLGKLKKEIEIIKSDGTIIFSNFRDQKTDVQLIKYINQNIENGQTEKFIEGKKSYRLVRKEKLNLEGANYQEVYFLIRTLKNDVSKEFYPLYVTIFEIFFFITITCFVIRLPLHQEANEKLLTSESA